MIKKLLIIAGCALTTFSNAQQNLDFETWGGVGPSADWTAQFALFAAGSVTQETANPSQGASAAKLQTVNCAFCGFFSLPTTMPGLIQMKVPYTNRPISMTYDYRGYIETNDEALVFAALTRWDTITNSADFIGQAIMQYPGMLNFTSWQNESVNFQYNPGTPDTLTIIVISSDSLAITGSGLPDTYQSTNTNFYIDNMQLVLPVGIKENINLSTYRLFPNPANDKFTVATSDASAEKVKIFDVTGRLVGTYDLEDKKVNVSTENYSNGMYIYSIYDANNKVLHTSKFNVAK